MPRYVGELLVYPGSHEALSAHLRTHPSELEKLRTIGSEHLPTGEGTDAMFTRPVAHCTGRAGDAFIVNHMTAHLIAPNTSSEIRYKVYFRLSGPTFERRKAAGGGNVHAMLSPWLHWEGLQRRCTDAEADGEATAAGDAAGEGRGAIRKGLGFLGFRQGVKRRVCARS